MLAIQCDYLKSTLDTKTQIIDDAHHEILARSNFVHGMLTKVNELEDAAYNMLPEHMICSEIAAAAECNRRIDRP